MERAEKTNIRIGINYLIRFFNHQEIIHFCYPQGYKLKFFAKAFLQKSFDLL